MALIGVVALVVIGPERLPGVAKKAGQWIGSARRFMGSVQADINREVGKTDELKRLLEEQTNIQSMHEILEQTPADPEERKPVPRAASSSKKPLENTSEYLVKAIDDMPVIENNEIGLNESSSDSSDNALSKKDD